jgi:hypothetical protein
MALDALTIATQGLLDTAELIAVQGLLESGGPTPPAPTPTQGFASIGPSRRQIDHVLDKLRKKKRDKRNRMLILLMMLDS